VTRLLLPALALALAGCVKHTLPSPEDDDFGAIGTRVWVHELHPGYSYGENTRTRAAQGVYFIRLPDEGDSLKVAEVHASQYTDGSVNYLFNLKPGRYAVVAAWANAFGKNIVTYFPKDAIIESTVELKRGGLGFCGDIRSRATWDLGKADDWQRYYMRTVDPVYYEAGILKRMVTKTDAQVTRSVKVNRGEKAQGFFFDGAKRLFGETTWRHVLEQTSVADQTAPKPKKKAEAK